MKQNSVPTRLRASLTEKFPVPVFEEGGNSALFPPVPGVAALPGEKKNEFDKILFCFHNRNDELSFINGQKPFSNLQPNFLIHAGGNRAFRYKKRATDRIFKFKSLFAKTSGIPGSSNDERRRVGQNASFSVSGVVSRLSPFRSLKVK